MTKISGDKMRDLLNVYFIMGSTNCVSEPTRILEQAIKGGITIFQYREKGKGAYTGDKKYHFAKQLQTICKENNIPFIVNDDIELALQLDADGIHIGQDDASAKEVRQKIGDKILGVSTHNLVEVKKAIDDGADYVGIGPIYPTKSKEDARTPQGTSLINEVRINGMKIPIVGIGGITSENAAPIIKSGGDGVAVISEISLAKDPKENAIKLVQAITF